LEAICARALAADTADRYATAEELADDLEKFVRHPRGYRLWVVALVVLLLAAGAVGLVYLVLVAGE
jgi:hypothetical protein